MSQTIIYVYYQMLHLSYVMFDIKGEVTFMLRLKHKFRLISYDTFDIMVVIFLKVRSILNHSVDFPLYIVYLEYPMLSLISYVICHIIFYVSYHILRLISIVTFDLIFVY